MLLGHVFDELVQFSHAIYDSMPIRIPFCQNVLFHEKKKKKIQSESLSIFFTRVKSIKQTNFKVGIFKHKWTLKNVILVST